MDLTLYGIIKHLLNEAPEEDSTSVIDNINYAINNKKFISLYYNDQKGNTPRLKYYGNPRGFRRIVPYCLFEKNGTIYLRAFHSWRTNTKRGPLKWKQFIVNNIKNLRVYKTWPSFSEKDIPSNANPNGDKAATRVLNIVKFNQFISPLEREKQKTAQIAAGRKKEPTNKTGYVKNQEIGADQKRKVTAKDIARIQPKYNEYDKNINKEIERLQNDKNLRNQRFADYDKAYSEAEQQNKKGPIGNEEDIEEV